MVLAACGGEHRATSDARASCTETAAPHDEDGDGVVDACDNCPTIVNPNQSDASETAALGFPDGVGDACDLRPRLGGDVLRAFYSFESADQATAWTGTGFSISDDALHATDDASWTTKRATSIGGVLVLAHVASIAFGSAGELALGLDSDGTTAGVTCALSAQQLVARELGGVANMVTLSPAIDAMVPVTFIAWRAVVATPTGSAATLICRVTRGDASDEVRLELADALGSGMQVIAARDASLAITSVSVYTSPGPKNP